MQDPKYAEAMTRTQATLDAELGTAGNNWSSPPIVEHRPTPTGSWTVVPGLRALLDPAP